MNVMKMLMVVVCECEDVDHSYVGIIHKVEGGWGSFMGLGLVRFLGSVRVVLGSSICVYEYVSCVYKCRFGFDMGMGESGKLGMVWEWDL